MVAKNKAHTTASRLTYSPSSRLPQDMRKVCDARCAALDVSFAVHWSQAGKATQWHSIPRLPRWPKMQATLQGVKIQLKQSKNAGCNR